MHFSDSHIRRQHQWLFLQLLLVAAFLIAKCFPSALRWWAETVIAPVRHGMAWIASLFPFSLMELWYVVLIVWIVVFLVRTLISLFRPGKKGPFLLRRLLLASNVALTITALFCILWGSVYYATSFQEKTGLYAEESTVEELASVTRYFAENAGRLSRQMPRSDGSYDGSYEEILALGTDAYANLTEQFPFLSYDDMPAKPVFFSKIMSLTGFTGVTFPLTGETCINVDIPVYNIPEVMLHEMAHSRGYALEQECNFIAILAGICHDDLRFQYSCYYSGYIHLSNALYRVAPERYRAIRADLPEEMRLDLANQSAYWDQWETSVVSKVSEKAYDAFLKSNGETAGVQSYGLVTDLLVTYFKNKIV